MKVLTIVMISYSVNSMHMKSISSHCMHSKLNKISLSYQFNNQMELANEVNIMKDWYHGSTVVSRNRCAAIYKHVTKQTNDNLVCVIQYESYLNKQFYLKRVAMVPTVSSKGVLTFITENNIDIDLINIYQDQPYTTLRLTL